MRPRRKLLVAVVVSALAAEGADAQQPASILGAPDARTYAELLPMTDTRQFDPALVDRALASRSPALRAAATLAIGQIGPEHGMAGSARLRRLLTDNEIVGAANAAYAIGPLRDSASIPELTAALSGNHGVAREAAWALGETGTPARSAIPRAVAGPHPTDVTVQL